MRWTLGLFVLAFAVFTLNFNQGVVQSVSTNFYKEDLGVVGAQMGVLTAAREFTGFIIVLLAALTMRFPPGKVAAAALLIAALGYGSYSQAQSFPQLVLVGMVGGLGFHGWLQLYYALALSMAPAGTEGSILGRLSSIGSAGTLLAMVITYFIVNLLGYRNMFIFSATVVATGGVALMFLPPVRGAVRQASFVLNRRYWLFYVLNFLDGCRFEIFTTFALFALVDVYRVDVRTITLILIINSITNWFAAPILGRSIDKYGERVVLTLTYAMHGATFLGFALVHNVWFLCAMYLLARLFMVAGMGINTYLKKIAEPKELSPSLAMGVSTSHMAAIVIPITGGILWQTFGYEISFLFGAFFVVLSLFFTQRIDARDYRPEYRALASAAAGGKKS